jgi:peptide/nickel transport system substrate-binding protein
MNVLKLLKLTLFLLIISLLIPACKSDPQTAADKGGKAQITEISIRQDTEPDMLNPVLSPLGYVLDICQHIFLPLMEYHPTKLTYDPVLVKAQPVISDIEEGPYAGGTAYSYEILDEAVWDNGEPVTAADYVFTVKLVLNPRVNAAVWRGYLSYIKDVEIDPEDPQKFTVLTYPQNILSKEISGNFHLFPEYIYDPEKIMRNFTLEELVDPEEAAKLAESDERLQQFADQFHSETYSRSPEGVVGCGPYSLKAWESGQRIVLERKENYWADELEGGRPYLRGYPDRVVFEPIPDFSAATSKVMAGEIDVMGALQPQQFTDLRKSEEVQENFNFYTPEVMQYYWMPLNTKSPVISDKRVRRALAHIVDLNRIQEEYMYGMAERIIGPIHPSQNYYNNNLKLIPFDLDKAAELLKEAGWEDTNNNGTLDKMIGGEQKELVIRYFAYPASELSQKIGLIMQENAKKVGMKIDMILKDFRTVRSENVAKRDYEIFSARTRRVPSLYDPSQSWHSRNDRPDGGKLYRLWKRGVR